jgi:hypothetical protein
MSNYQLTPIANTETALNCDVTSDELYLGRLYVFPTTNTALHDLGIEKEWFLAHKSGDFVVSGHVNAVGEWCVSSHRSLEPNLEFTSQAEVFDRIFSPDYEKEVMAIQEMLSNEILSNEPVRSILHQDLNSVIPVSGSEDEEEDGSKPIVEPIKVAINNELNIPNLEVLRELLRRSSAEELKEIAEDFAPQFDELQEVTEVNVESIVLPLVSNVVQEEAGLLVDEEIDQIDRKFWELKIVEVQDALIDRVVEEYQERETTEFAISPFGLVTVHVEEEYFVLSSAQDGHTVIAATLEGEVLEELDESDVAEFEQVLKHSQTEISRLESLPGEELGDSAPESEMDAKEDDLANRTGGEKKSKGIEYGS